jgi:asparagine synthase (glutamine-hydrolysing)
MLDSSVHDRLMADVPVGVLLSGGLDSTTLVALLRERAHGLATFSVGFADQPQLDERAEARRVANEFGTNHHEVVVTQGEAIASLGDLVHHQDEPLADPVCIPLHFVCRLARENGIKVVLAGEGSDELFWGYPRYRILQQRWPWIKALMKLPRPALVAAAAAVPSRKPQIRELLEQLATKRPLPMHMPLGLPRAHRARVLHVGGSDLGPGWTPSDTVGDAEADPWTRLGFDTQEYEFGLRLPELLLMRIDRFSMANSVEARVPFLDPDLVGYAYRLPFDFKLNRGHAKAILKEAVADVVPEWVINRPKQGFGAPVDNWMQSELGDLFAKLLDDYALRAYFDVDFLRASLAGKAPRVSLWPIMNFALWHRHWIQGDQSDYALELATARVA